MSQENVEITLEAIEAYNAEGIEALLPFYSPDIVVYAPAEWLEASEYRGHAGVRKLVGNFTNIFDDWAWTVQEVRDPGSQVVFRAEMTGRIEGSGVPVSQMVSTVASGFRDGTIGEVRFFGTWQEALEAVGLSE